MPARAKRRATRGIVRRQKNKSKSTAIIKPEQLSIPEAIEKVLILGDLSSLQPQERVDYYKRVCVSLGLNPLTMPFTYILFREFDNAPAKLSLYANKSCTEQLRKIHGVGVIPPLRKEIDMQRKVIIVEADVRDRTGKTDTATGVVSLTKVKDGRTYELSDREYCNALMKCETKAKRRATLSICGLAFLDESELDTMQVVGGVTPDGRIFRYAEHPPDEPPPQLSEQAPHGHTPGSAKAKQAEAQLAKVEAADREALGAQNVVPRASIPREEPKAAEKAVSDAGRPVLEVEAVGPDRFRIMGDIQDLYPMVSYHCACEDGFWFCNLAKLEEMQAIALKMKFIIKVVPSKQVVGKKDKPTTKTAPASGNQIPAGPELVTGTIERTNMGKAGPSPVQNVTLILADNSKPFLSCFHKSLWPEIEKGLGKVATFVVSRNGKFTNIEKLRKIGSREWDEEGKIVLQQKDREAGAKTLFGT